MPAYEVTAPGGRRFRLEGDAPPSESDLDEVFDSPQPTQAPPFDLAEIPSDKIPLVPNSETQRQTLHGVKPESGMESGTELTTAIANNPLMFAPRVALGLSNELLSKPAEKLGAMALNALHTGLSGNTMSATKSAFDDRPVAVAGNPMMKLPAAEDPGALGAISRLAQGATTPGNLLMLPVASVSKPLQGALAMQSALGAAESLSQLPKDTSGSLTEAAAQLLMAGALGRSAMRSGSTVAKGKPNAIPKQSAEEIPLVETSRSSPEMGARIPEPEKPTTAPEGPENVQEKAPKTELTRVANLSPAEFSNQFKAGFTETAIALGKQIKPEEIQPLLEQMDTRLKAAQQKAIKSETDAAIQEFSDLAYQRQFVSEALQGAKEQSSTPQPQSTPNIAPKTSGIISGSQLELWADKQLAAASGRAYTGVDPELLAAYAIKGAAVIERGVTKFSQWSAEMLKQYGDTIKPHLEDIYRESLLTVRQPQRYAVEGDKLKMRKSAERATASEQVPAPVQERIAQAPESFYKQQSMKSVEDTVSGLSDAELGSLRPDSNVYVAGKLELSKRLFDAGKHEEGYRVFKSVSSQGTDFGQNINQFKFLKGQTPANVVHLVNEGLKEAGRDPLTPQQMESLAQLANKSIDANKALEAAKSEWEKNPTDANAAKADDALKSADAAALETQRDMNRYKIKTWPQMLKTFAQGNPITPASHVANFLGNVGGAAMESASRTLAAGMDTIRAALTGGERKVSVQPLSGTAASAKAYASGIKTGAEILKRGSGDVVKGENIAGLQPLRSLAKAFSRNPDVPTVGGKVPFMDRAKLAVEGTFGIAPEAMLRLLSAADKPAYESARARLITEQSNIQKLPRSDWAMAQKFPELFFDRDALKRINLEAADAVFQRPSKTISYLQSWISDRKYGDWADLAFTMLVAPYKRTPWNLVVRTLNYNPLVAALRVGIDSVKGDVRGAEMNAGRMIVGGMIYTAGYYLYKNGLIGPSLDDRDETQKTRLLAGEVLPPNHVNVSGLKRLLKGEDPNYKPSDETWDLTRGGGAAGAILTSVANIGRDFEKAPADQQNWGASLFLNSTLQQASFTINQSFLKGVTGIIDAVMNRNIGPYISSVENMFLNIGTPNTLTSLSRATRENVPDMKPGDWKEQIGNVVKNRFGIFGADDYMTAKRDLWGEPLKQTPEGRNALIYHLFDISKGKQVTDDPVALELYHLWRSTSSGEVIPSIPDRNQVFANNKHPLTTDQYSRFSELVGKARRQIVDPLVRNPQWQSVPDEIKMKILTQAYNRGAAIGKAQFFAETPPEQLKQVAPKAGFKPAVR